MECIDSHGSVRMQFATVVEDVHMRFYVTKGKHAPPLDDGVPDFELGCLLGSETGASSDGGLATNEAICSNISRNRAKT
jgi:hypothetical protein